MTASTIATGSYDPEAQSVKVRLPGGSNRRVAFDVPAFPDDPPCDASLAIDDAGHVVSITFVAADRPSQGCCSSGPHDFVFPMRLSAEGSVELLLDDTVVPTRRLTFDWPGDVPRWFIWADADDTGRLHSVTFSRPDWVLASDVMRTLRDR